MKTNLNEDKSSDIQQFAELLETLLEYCDDFEEYREVGVSYWYHRNDDDNDDDVGMMLVILFN